MNKLPDYYSPRGSSLKEMLEQQNADQMKSGERGRVLSRDAYLAQQRKYKGPGVNSPRGVVGQETLPILPTKPNSATIARRVEAKEPRPHTSRGPTAHHQQQELVDPTRGPYVSPRQRSGVPLTADSKSYQRDLSKHGMSHGVDVGYGSNTSALDGRLHVSNTSGKVLIPGRTTETMVAGQHASRYNHDHQQHSYHPTHGGHFGESVDDDASTTQAGTTYDEGITTPSHGNGTLVVIPTPPPVPPRHDNHHHTSVIRYSLEHPTQLEVNRSVLSDSINELCAILSEYRELRIGLSEEERDKLIDLSGLANWNELQQLGGGGGGPLNSGGYNNTNTIGEDNNNATGDSSGSGGGPTSGSETTPMSPLLWHLYNRASVLGIASQPQSYAAGENNERSYVGSGSATPYLPPSYTDRNSNVTDWRLADAVSPPLPASINILNMKGSTVGGRPQPSSRATAPTPPSSMSFGQQEDTNAVLGSPRPPRPITPACASRATGNNNNNNNNNNSGVNGSFAASMTMSTAPVIPSVPADMVDWMCTTCQDMLASDLPMATILNALVEQVQQSVPEVYTINVWVYSSAHNMLYRLDNERVHTAPLDPDVPVAPSSSSGNQRVPSSRGRRPVSRLLDGSHSKIQSPADTSVDSAGGTAGSGAQRPTSGFGDDSSTTEALIMSTFLSKVPKADSARIVMPLFITPTTNTPSLPTRDGVFGVLEILGSRGSELNLVDASQSAILCSVGSFVYSILHHRRQRERYNRKVQSVDSVVQIANQLANVTNLDENKLVRDIMAVAMSVCEAERSAIFLPSGNGDGSLSEMVAHGSGGQTLRVPQGHGIVGHVAETGVGMNVDDAYSCPYFYEEADRTNNFTTKAILCLPVHYEGSIVAVAELLNKKTKSNGGPSSFTREDEEHFENLMTLVGLCLRNCKKSHELIVEKAKIEALFASVLEISSTDITKLNAVLSGIVDTACTLGYPVFNFAFVLRYDMELQELLVDSSLFPTNRRTMHPSNSKGDDNDVDEEAPPPNPPTLKRYPPGKGVAGLCYTTGEVQLALNLSSETPYDPEVDVPFLTEKEASSVSALLSIPLISGKDVIGILQFVRVEDPSELVDVSQSHLNEYNESKAVMAVVNPSTLGRPQSSGSASRVATPKAGQRPPRGGSASSRNRTQETTTGGAWLTLRQSPVPVDRWSNPSPLQQPIVPTLPRGIRPPGRHSHNRPHLVPTSHTEKGLSLVYDWDDISGPSDELISLLKGFAVFAAIWIHNADLIDFTVKAGKAATKLSTVFRSKRPGARAQFHVDRSEVNLVLRTAVPDAFIHSISSPDFNLWSVRQSADIAPLLVASRVVFDLMWSTGLPQKFGCREETLATFIVACRSKYRPVPYHNFFHAVDVTQTIFHYMYTGGASELLTPLEQFVALVVGLTHDLDHMGLNNNYHIKTDTPLGILSAVGGSQSVLEVRHCNLAVEILSAEESNIFEGLSKEDVTTAYHLLIEAILGTDMAKHAACVQQLKEWDPAGFDYEKPDHRKFAFGVVVKVADVSNISKPFEISKKWAVAVTEEFSQQGDNEKSQGISDILPLFDREKNADLAKGQLGFIQFVAEPFYKLVVEKLFPGMQYALDNIQHNVATWKQLQQN